MTPTFADRSQIPRPCVCLLGCQRAFAQAIGDAGVALDLVDGEVLVGAEPKPAHRHGVARPGLELAAVTRAVEHQEASWWKADTAAPRECQSTMRLLDEVVEITVPAVVEVREEHQPAAIVHKRPMGEVNRAHATEVSVGRLNPQEQAQ